MLGRTFRSLAPLILLSGALASVAAAQTIDQQSTGPGNIDLGHTGSDVGNSGGGSFGWGLQGFKPTETTSAGGGILLGTGNVNGTLSIELWNDVPSNSGAQELASGTATVTGDDQYYTAFWNPVTVTPGSQYFLAFFSDEAYYPQNGHSHTPGDGQYFLYNNSSNDTDTYVGNGCCSADFVEYSTGPVQTTTPEPSSMALLGTGIIGLVPMIRRRRKTA